MRLAYLSTDPGIALGAPKGAAVHVAEVVEALAAQGVEVLLLIARDDSRAPVAHGVTVECLPDAGRGGSALERVAAQPSLRRWLERRLRRFGADALYERLALHSDAGTGAARAIGIPHLVELNAPLPEEAARYRSLGAPPLAELLERRVLAGADLVLAVSRPLAAYAQARGARRVEVMPNAVALERFTRSADQADRDPVAVFAGSLRPWHGIETVAAAWRLLGSAAPRLLVLGEGPARRELADTGAELAGTVPRGDVPAALAHADIGLVPYGPESPAYFSPLKLFEYMAAGLAVVAAEIPGVSDVVGEREALLVPPGDPDALAGAVAVLARQPEARRRMGQAARERVAAEHTWSQRARRIADAAMDLPAPARLAS